MNILMLETRIGCSDGHNLVRYEQSVIYPDVANNLACDFINKGWATEVEDDSIMAGMERIKKLMGEIA